MKILPAILAAGLAFGAAGSALAADALTDAITDLERQGINGALSEAGCENPLNIERDGAGFTVENASCDDGRFYNFQIDERYQIVGKDMQG